MFRLASASVKKSKSATMLKLLLSFLRYGVPAIAVFGLFIALFQYLVTSKAEVAAEPRQPTIWTVEMVSAKRQDAAPVSQAYGTVQAARSADLRFGLNGQVAFVSDVFQNGLTVAEGVELASLDKDRYQLALEDVLVQIEAEQANIKALTQQTALRTRTFERTQNMFKRKVATEANLDEAELALSVTANQLDQAEARLARLKVSERNRRKDLEDAALTAPFAGRLVDVSIGLGRQVSSGVAVAQLIDLNSLEVPFVVPAEIYADATNLIGRQVELIWRSGGRDVARHYATITRAEALVDKTEGGGRLYAELGPSGSNGVVPPGAFVEILFIGKTFENVFELPEEALFGEDEVFVANLDGIAQSRRVSVEHRHNGRIWVSGDLVENEKVIATRLPGLGAGTQVRSAN